MIVPGIIDTPILDKKREETVRGFLMTPSEERLDPVQFVKRMSGIRALYPPERAAEDVLRGGEGASPRRWAQAPTLDPEEHRGP